MSRYVDGTYNRASGTRDAFAGLSSDLVAEGHPPMTVTSGDREPTDQLAIWNQRMTLTPNGRKVYGREQWQGRTWFRIHPDKVGVPGTSNHEKRRANDLAWPYNSTATAAHKRARILAPRHNISCEGLSFGEAWHWTFWGPLSSVGVPAAAGSSASPIQSEEDDMATLVTGGGQNLIIGNKLIPLTSAAQVQSIEGAQLLKVSPEVHYHIIQAFSRPDSAALPTLVYVRNGDGTVYLLTDGKLEALVDPTTLAELHGKGAVSVTLSQAEITNLLNT